MRVIDAVIAIIYSHRRIHLMDINSSTLNARTRTRFVRASAFGKCLCRQHSAVFVAFAAVPKTACTSSTKSCHILCKVRLRVGVQTCSLLEQEI